MRYLLFRHYGACFAVLFIAIMIWLRFWLFPAIFTEYGDLGFTITMAAIFGLGFLIEKLGIGRA